MDLLKKLNHSNQTEIFVLKAPPEFFEQLEEFRERLVVLGDIGESTEIPFVLVFAKDTAELEPLVRAVLPFTTGQSLLWFAYPKKSSKKYHSDITRDTGWTSLGNLGFEPVRQIAIDDDWSALRFKHVDRIKTLLREPAMAISPDGKKRTENR